MTLLFSVVVEFFFLRLLRRSHKLSFSFLFFLPQPQEKKKTPTMPPAPVPETALKKRRRDEEWAAARATAAAEARTKRAASRADAFKRAESYVTEYRAQVRSILSLLSRTGDD